MQSSEIKAFLAEPMSMAQVASVAPSGAPLLGSLWFLYESGRFWFNSHQSSPLVQAVARGISIAVLVDDFTPPDQIRQIRVRGSAEINTHDGSVVRRIYERYLGPDLTSWSPFFQERVVDDSWSLWSVSPDTGVATVNPDFHPTEVRWGKLDDSPLPRD